MSDNKTDPQTSQDRSLIGDSGGSIGPKSRFLLATATLPSGHCMRDIQECHRHRAHQKLGHRALETCIYVPLKPSLPHLCHRGTLGESLVLNSTPRSSCGVTRPDELYTLIFRLGRGSSRGELVIGILSETSWRAYTGPRYMAAAFVKSGGTVSRSAGIRKKRKKVNKEEKTGT